MNPPTTDQRADLPSPVITGRDGAVDHMAKWQTTGTSMEEHIYRVIEIVGTSEESIEGAIRMAIDRASRTLRNLRWFEVVRTSGHITDGKVQQYQVTLKVGFTMEGPA